MEKDSLPLLLCLVVILWQLADAVKDAVTSILTSLAVIT